MALLALVHVTLVVALTIFPIPIGGQDFYRQTRGMSQDNIVPFATIVEQLVKPGLNTSASSAATSWRSPRSASTARLSGRRCAGGAGSFSPPWPSGRAIELTQYAGSLIEGFTYRVTDVDDAIMNATGAILVYAASPPVKTAAPRQRPDAAPDGSRRLAGASWRPRRAVR